MKENEINIEDRISLARRTTYALMNTGLHGSNGINPSAAIKRYEAYVIPKLYIDPRSLKFDRKNSVYCLFSLLAASLPVFVLLHYYMIRCCVENSTTAYDYLPQLA
jgi:hypothetical protein